MPLLTAGIISGAASVIGGIFGASSANKAARAARAERNRLNAKLEQLKENRQEITNPYAGSEDLSSMISNPFENLGVATQAAEMQIEQADISLANTLDTIRSTGASAGGATALAQAALQSKKGVSANIEQQEAKNEQLAAQGKQSQERMIMAEKQRMQNVEAQGNIFQFQAQESRDMADMDRLSAQISGAQARQSQAQADRTGAITGGIGGVVSTVGSMYSAGAFSPSASTSNNYVPGSMLEGFDIG